eukprot:6184365-Prymnesium_polylepis.2
MARAVYGAKQVTKALRFKVVGGLNLEVSEALREIGRGQWVNRTREEIAADWVRGGCAKHAHQQTLSRKRGVRDRVKMHSNAVRSRTTSGGPSVERGWATCASAC